MAGREDSPMKAEQLREDRTGLLTSWRGGSLSDQVALLRVMRVCKQGAGWPRAFFWLYGGAYRENPSRDPRGKTHNEEKKRSLSPKN